MDNTVILKIGGSVITKKSEDKLEVDERNLNRIAKEIAGALKRKKFHLVVVHGAGPFGHVPAEKYGLDAGYRSKSQLEGFSLTHQSMEKLNYIVVEALRRQGIPAVAYQPSAVGILKNKRLAYFPTGVIEGLLDLGMVPVCYGDVLLDLETGFSILSGDHLVPYLASKLNAKKVVIATDVDGIYDKDPKTGRNAKPVKEISRRNIKKILLSGSTSTDVTGGMKRKVEELLRLARKNKIRPEIVSALKPGNLRKVLLGERGLGTTITP